VAERSELVIVGDDIKDGGRYRGEMESLAGSLGCPARFVGFQEDVWAWLTAADLAVVPSHVEPLGNATLEAMACGLPVVGCSVGGIPEMVIHDETGLLVSPRSPEALASALARLLDDDPTRLQLGRQGRRRCEERFSLRVHIDSVVNEYNEVFQRARTVEIV
jgi:glycosyltransferase involved in cell wall biosynthesis